MRSILDASALLAWLQAESGAEAVEPLISEAFISAANWSEVLQKVAQKGKDAEEVRDLVRTLGLQVMPLTEEDAAVAAELWASAPALSLADRCCLALAHRLTLPAVTADGSWQELSVGVEVQSIR